jgi:NSS family neurotransmitter:Na+ symporter
MAAPTEGRGGFGSRIGFILAAAGSAIGLGNIWRFPYTAGQNGGGAFVIIYLICIFALCLPVLFAELSIGRASQKSPVGAFKALAPKTAWPLVGGLGVLTGFGILAFYSVVAGWTLAYLGWSVAGRFSGTIGHDESEALFNGLLESPTSVVLSGVFLLMTALVVRAGVQRGIERACKVLMPVFLLILVTLAARSLTLDGAREGLAFLFEPDFSKISIEVVISALGQALLSLSLGMGAMITYGSYLSRRDGMPGAAMSVALADTGIAILAGLIIFPALFAAGGEAQGGAGLVFIVLPTIFHKLPAAWFFGVAFYALLCIAALTSTLSLMEVIVSYFVDEHGKSRLKMTWIMAGACFLLALPSALSMDFFGTQDTLWGNYALVVGALLISVFVGWKWGQRAAVQEITRSGHALPLAAVWGFVIRYFAPIAILAILIFKLLGGQT